MSGNELGGFLRARREAIPPSEVGLPNGSRRRTPGLRRAELAILARLSVDYLTRLEQGRDRHPSHQVLAALADALRLSTEERLHLLRLSKHGSGGGICPAAADPPTREVRATVRALLDRLERAPAIVVNRLGDLLAHTAGYQRLAGPVGLLDADPPNLVRFLFTDPRARRAYPDWDTVADQQVASLKSGSWRADPHLTQLIETMTVLGGAPFADRLAAPDMVPTRTGVHRLVHPEVGELRLAYETLEVPEAGEQRLVAYLPADDPTSAALDRLSGPARDARPDELVAALPGPPAKA